MTTSSLTIELQLMVHGTGMWDRASIQILNRKQTGYQTNTHAGCLVLLPPTADKRCGSFSHQNTARLLVTDGERGRNKGREKEGERGRGGEREGSRHEGREESERSWCWHSTNLLQEIFGQRKNEKERENTVSQSVLSSQCKPTNQLTVWNDSTNGVALVVKLNIHVLALQCTSHISHLTNKGMYTTFNKQRKYNVICI